MVYEYLYKDIIGALYLEPFDKLKSILGEYIKQNALLLNKPPNEIYLVIYKGENLYSEQPTQEWDAELIDIHPDLLPDIDATYTMILELRKELTLVSSHIRNILNSCETPEDPYYLLNHNLHQYLPVKADTHTKKISALSREYKAYLDTYKAGRDSLINERILTNLLIKNL